MHFTASRPETGRGYDLLRVTPDLTYRMHFGIAAGMRQRGGVGGRSALAALGLFRERPDLELEFLRSRDIAGRVVFDIGAYRGMYTLFFASRVGARGEVVAFEPHPDNYDRLVTNVALNAFHNVTAIPVGLAAGPGELTFATSSDPGRTSASADIAATFSGDVREFRVPVTSVDVEREARQLPAPDFVKIDVEGLELDVLQGMQRTLADDGPELFIELHGVGLDRKRSNSAAVAELLLGAGYAVVHVESGTRVPTPAASQPEGHLSAAVPAAGPRERPPRTRRFESQGEETARGPFK